MSGQVRNTLENLLGKKSRWPNPERSVGDYLQRIRGDQKRDKMCWEAVGPAREAFTPLAEEIVEFLNSNVEDIPGQEPVSFFIYMIGKEERRAAPYVMFFCEDPKSRKRIHNAVKKSGILGRYPGIKTGNAPRDPGLGQIKQLALENISHQSILRSKHSRLGSPISISGNKVCLTSQCGSTILTKVVALGGVIRHNDDSYILTAGHPFDTTRPACRSREVATIGEEWEIDSGTTSETASAGYCDHTLAATKQSKSTPLAIRAATNNGPGTRPRDAHPKQKETFEAVSHSTKPQVFTQLATEQVGRCGTETNWISGGTIPPTTGERLERNPGAKASFTHVEGRMEILSSDLDYALIKIGDSNPFATGRCSRNETGVIPLQPVQVLSAATRDTEVITYTASSGFMTGILRGTPSYARLPNSKTFQKVYIVRFNGQLVEGDCGSWVFDAKTRGLHGHIVAGCDRTGSAYVMAAQSIIEDAQKRLGGILKLYSNLNFDLESPGDFEREPSTPTNVTAKAYLRSSMRSEPATEGVNIGHGHQQASIDNHVSSEDNFVPKSCWAELEGSRENEGNLVRAFMLSDGESNVCCPQADKVDSFCYGANLNSLLNLKGGYPIALCDTQVLRDGIPYAEGRRGPLTAPELYYELKKPWSHLVPNSGESDTPETRNRHSQKIFVTDLDCWSIIALISTATKYQALTLRDTLYRHLAFETFVGETRSLEGKAIYQLSFHLPYYALRASEERKQDHRQSASGDSLRQSQNVSFLDCGNLDLSFFLYEAQISCAVTEIGSHWIAYCFVDTYFDANEEGRETVHKYHGSDEDPEKIRLDSFTRGAVERAILNPKDYFLCVFMFRLNQVKREWQQIVEKVRQSVREYEQINQDPVFSSSEQSTIKSPNRDLDLETQQICSWIQKLRHLIGKLLPELSKTVEACERFRNSYFDNYSQSLPEQSDGRRLLSTLQTICGELGMLKNTLESLGGRCDTFAHDLELHALHETLAVGHLQSKLAEQALLLSARQQEVALEALKISRNRHRLAQDNRAQSTYMMLFLGPIAMAAWIFSMSYEVIPFVPQNFASFTIVVMVFTALGIMITATQPFILLCLTAVWIWVRGNFSIWRIRRRTTLDEENMGVTR